MVQLPFLSKSKDSDNRFLIMDISSTEVKCLALYLDEKDSSVKIIGSGQRALDAGTAKSGFVLDQENISLAIREVVEQACQNSEEEMDKVIICAPSDLCSGLMTTVRAKRKRDKPVDKKELEQLYEKLREAATIQAQKDYLDNTGDNETELESIMETTVYAKVDNQMVKEVENVSAGVLEMAIFNAFAPSAYLNNIQSSIKKSGLQLLTIVPVQYGIVRTILNSDPNLNDFVLIDISNDNTGAAVVFGKGIISTRYLGIGMQQIIEGVTERMGLTYREADRLLKSYVKGQLTPTEGNIIRESLKDVLEIWISGLEILFTEYSGVKTFPSKIYLTGLGAELPELWNSITNEPWTKSVPFKEPPVYKKLTFMDITKIADSTGKVSSAEWLPLATLATAFMEMKGIDND
ncbi:hypothetical protein GYA27_04840 [candidate division WWE3 bacterium]|uniref:SHS2 domain-containing protein n=1 Tax=candidate division WWE3 bacterium TaxID=2053526 RepID=A0A7X9DLA0_UNCKA|nr:hypothetical protein [candidate division WWE3 bacterium]